MFYAVVSMPRLRQDQREYAVRTLMNGASQRWIADQLGVHKSSVSRLVNRLGETGTTNNRPIRTFACKNVSERRIHKVAHLRQRFRTATETATQMMRVHVCASTVRNRLRKFGVTERRPYVGHTLTPPELPYLTLWRLFKAKENRIDAKHFSV